MVTEVSEQFCEDHPHIVQALQTVSDACQWTMREVEGCFSRSVSVRVGLEGTGINDSLVVHQLVTLVIGLGVEIVRFGVTHDLVGFNDLGLARFLLRVLDFVQDVLTHDVMIQLGFAFTVESETPALCIPRGLSWWCTHNFSDRPIRILRCNRRRPIHS